MVLEKTLESFLDSKWIKSVLKEIIVNTHWKDWCWSSNTWPLDAKRWLTGKDPDAEKDWQLEMKGAKRIMASLTQWTPSLSKLQETVKGRPGVLPSIGSQSQTWLSDWTTAGLHNSLIYLSFVIFSTALYWEVINFKLELSKSQLKSEMKVKVTSVWFSRN